MFEPKVPVIGAVIGFVLSFLIGLVSGVAFPVVLLRAVIMAIVFGGFAFGGKFLIQKFIPDLFASASADSERPAEGGAVDITVGEADRDENPFKVSAADMGDVPDFARPQSSAVQETVPRPQYENSAPEGVFTPDPFLSSASSGSASMSGVFSEGSSDGLDVLPDLADFAPRTSNVSEGAFPAEDAGGGGSRDSLFDTSEVKTPASSVETETMAKAIRTILTRDS